MYFSYTTYALLFYVTMGTELSFFIHCKVNYEGYFTFVVSS